MPSRICYPPALSIFWRFWGSLFTWLQSNLRYVFQARLWQYNDDSAATLGLVRRRCGRLQRYPLSTESAPIRLDWRISTGSYCHSYLKLLCTSYIFTSSSSLTPTAVLSGFPRTAFERICFPSVFHRHVHRPIARRPYIYLCDILFLLTHCVPYFAFSLRRYFTLPSPFSASRPRTLP
ncbi:hypothetical protein R3P38DRAFT_3265898 [Favolaschia claudopus]|uniref:Secreted protein n=1 Tax=Favolaschia claudopus TaxID=2862362 RepID=A0AAW0C192_9AGAR